MEDIGDDPKAEKVILSQPIEIVIFLLAARPFALKFSQLEMTWRSLVVVKIEVSA